VLAVHEEEARLIDSFLGGEPEALSQIDRWISQAAWAFKRRLGEVWDDLLQDVRLEVTRLLKESRFRGEASLKTYLWRVTTNACVDRLRAQRKVRWEGEETLEQGGDPPGTRPLAAFERHEARDLILRVAAAMSEECRQLWRMIFEGLSYRQMSEQLGVAEGALRVRVLRCRRRAMEVRRQLMQRDTN
jgi:RNA polymerase sigma-70 factor (ECF subfamily)